MIWKSVAWVVATNATTAVAILATRRYLEKKQGVATETHWHSFLRP